MNDFKEKLIALLHDPYYSWNDIFRILKMDPELNYFDPFLPVNDSQLNLFPLIQNPSNLFLNPEKFNEQIQQYKKQEIEIITVFDDLYPSYLKEIYQPPWALFAKGEITLLEKEPKLAVVGSRQATQYGKNAIRMLFPELVSSGVVIVSGLAKGIDALAHESAMKNGGKTIAVIAGGLYHIYPNENMGLALEMFKSQLIVSEYPPDTKPLKWHFPARNRIISGLSYGTFIIEAKRKSGSLITANYALNEGREVFSLPGSIFNPNSNGANELIQQGAKLVTTAKDILDEMSYKFN
ncbi:DNA-protecting protein DprA [Bacillus sp. BRMEA1]|uniref:DNA-processing protein DprA n=1 Tax=Neobacillus endophyticus TaxID=2738405 RepID=UPI00156410A8|nr:DNA-processing protein DprA [Neobacillus endophyticus]NRD78861.1 DNA-protecting protein DprA [Neobacillus endophyticus]